MEVLGLLALSFVPQLAPQAACTGTTARAAVCTMWHAKDHQVVQTDVATAAAAAKTLLDESAPSAVVKPQLDLEVEPYHAIKENVPINTFKNKAPLIGTIASVKRIAARPPLARCATSRSTRARSSSTGRASRSA